MLSIARIYYPVTVLGPGNRAGIWTAGCSRGCRGCLSPELQNEANGRKMTARQVAAVLRAFGQPIDGVTVSGGEPFLHPADLLKLTVALLDITDDIIVFTGYLYEELLADSVCREVLSRISVLIDGEYREDCRECAGLRGSSNQRIICLRDPERYRSLADCRCGLQTVIYGSRVLTIGIPHGENNDQYR